MKEWARGNRRPQNYKELFNLRHASLRNVIERAFGIVKKRFPILTQMTNYPYEFHIRLVKACFMLHNFIRLNQGYEDEYDAWDPYTEGDGNGGLGNEDDDEGGEIRENQNEREVNQKKDTIAREMWESYQQELLTRGRDI